eukprot:SAG31_NODE_2919_length_4912_cov_52.769790_6_plen_86_part_00
MMKKTLSITASDTEVSWMVDITEPEIGIATAAVAKFVSDASTSGFSADDDSIGLDQHLFEAEHFSSSHCLQRLIHSPCPPDWTSL